ncbi:MAG: putative entry exclusion protein TrbK-alt, partial [Mesorhizobium sp.]
MDGKMLARLGAVVFIAIAITATMVEMARKEDVPTSPAARALEPKRDPLRESQR